jgi:eukaryotic-like serine/threonine-protein kinase
MSGAVDDSDRRAMTYRVFAEALDLLGDVRERFLEEHCRADAQLRAEVAALLAIAEAGPGGVETGALAGAAPQREPSQTGKIFGRFRLREQIGEGGMGVVYLAERTDGVQQLVAVKLVSTVLATAAQHRLEREVRILARLEHASVARLIDAGVEGGRAWVAIEYVRGERIDAYCAARNLSTPGIVRLLVQLSAAVSAAHALLVVHSDIKPANVLVTAEGLPKLIDFGIATALREAEPARAATVEVGRLFSPNYAALEQLSGGAITVATDVFGLGALAYRLLTGAPIYREANSPVAYLMAVNQRDVEAPSRAALAGGRGESAARALRGDLDAILCKALEREPNRRYASAADFQADLQRYLDGRPVTARAPSIRYRAVKFARRNALAVGLASLLSVSVVAGGVTVWLQSRSTALARDMAARRGEFLESMLKSANPREGKRDITVAELLDAAARGLDEKLGAEPLVEASLLGLIADTNTELGRYPEALATSDRQLALLRREGASARDLALAMADRGDLLSRANRYDEAETTLKAAIADLRRQSGEKPALVQTLSSLAGVYANTNRNPAAETALAEAIVLDQQRTGFPQQQLAVVLGNEGRYAESATFARAALDLERKYLPADNPTVLITESNYAMTLANLHRPAEALPLQRQVADATARVLGPDHPDTLLMQAHVAEDLFDLGRFAEAATIEHHAAESLDRAVGENHRYARGVWIGYAMAACNTDDAPAGLAAAKRVADIRARILPAIDWQTATIHGVIGLCLAHLKRYAEAEPMLLQASAILEASRGANFYQTQLAYTTLRDMYAAMGRSADAAVFGGKIEKVK